MYFSRAELREGGARKVLAGLRETDECPQEHSVAILYERVTLLLAHITPPGTIRQGGWLPLGSSPLLIFLEGERKMYRCTTWSFVLGCTNYLLSLVSVSLLVRVLLVDCYSYRYSNRYSDKGGLERRGKGRKGKKIKGYALLFVLKYGVEEENSKYILFSCIFV